MIIVIAVLLYCCGAIFSIRPVSRMFDIDPEESSDLMLLLLSLIVWPFFIAITALGMYLRHGKRAK